MLKYVELTLFPFLQMTIVKMIKLDQLKSKIKKGDFHMVWA